MPLPPKKIFKKNNHLFSQFDLISLHTNWLLGKHFGWGISFLFFFLFLVKSNTRFHLIGSLTIYIYIVDDLRHVNHCHVMNDVEPNAFVKYDAHVIQTIYGPLPLAWNCLVCSCYNYKVCISLDIHEFWNLPIILVLIKSIYLEACIYIRLFYTVHQETICYMLTCLNLTCLNYYWFLRKTHLSYSSIIT